ncbi:glycoside hydrolase family 26 protein [Rosettibacter firmus]|uniref:glycoside hydrolase family 26 protein n=1 Tax=Rosettibacter firmus TaxID=3111522 RepID=UPI00336BC638
MKLKLIFSILIFVILISCVPEYNSIYFQKKLNVKLVDSSASKETVLLFYNLKKLSEHKIIFGHHDATAYGVGWFGKDSSDVKSVVNSYPGLYGWDFSHITSNKNNPVKNYMKKLVLDAYKRGGVNTFCWHYNNPVTDGSFYDTTIAVKKILPGGGFYLKYLRALDSIADFANNLKDSTGEPIPIIFRPFHEFDGSWFWWGKNFCTKEEFIELWRTTVNYLRNKKGVKNFLYAYSPDRNFYSEEEYLERYPGDEFVDILGMDDYYDFVPGGDGIEWITKKLSIITKLAKKKNKIAAFTETGLEGIVNHKWWTDRLLKSFDNDSIKIAYLMVWRNANETHHYAPYKGHPSAENFVEFVFSPKILLEKDLPNLYKTSINDNIIEKINFKKNLDIIKTMGFYPVRCN